MYAIGIDPDVKTPAFAAYDIGKGKITAVGCVKVKLPAGVKGQNRLPYLSEAVRDSLSSSLLLTGGMVQCICIEGQSIRKNSPATPQSILMLAAAAGIVAQCAFERWRPSMLGWAQPHDWKGDVPKRVHQARLCSKLGWTYKTMGGEKSGYACPDDPGCWVHPSTVASDWKHLMDAVGLALFAANGFKR